MTLDQPAIAPSTCASPALLSLSVPSQPAAQSHSPFASRQFRNKHSAAPPPGYNGPRSGPGRRADRQTPHPAGAPSRPSIAAAGRSRTRRRAIEIARSRRRAVPPRRRAAARGHDAASCTFRKYAIMTVPSARINSPFPGQPFRV